MLEKVRKWIKAEQMIEDGESIVAGVSGGADSVALLMVMLDLKEEYHLALSVVHVNHGIRKIEAKEDAEYVKGLCETYNVPFFLYESSVPELSKKWQVSEETAGRKLRYQCFFEVAKKTGASCIATAHHMVDQAETVLFHMARGSNLAGAAGIRPVSVIGEREDGIRIIRPLLCCEKEEITAYLKQQDIKWCEDATNADDSYTRNKIRNQILPVLKEINSKAIPHIAGFASELLGYEEFFNHMVEEYMLKEVSCKIEYGTEKLSETDCETNRHRLSDQSPLLAKAVIYQMITKAAGKKQDITKEHVQLVYGLLDSQSGKRIRLPYQTEAVCSYEKLFIQKSIQKSSCEFFDYCIYLDKIWNNEKGLRISLPQGGAVFAKICTSKELQNIDKISKKYYTKVFDCDTIKGTLHVRNPLPEDYFIINEKGNRKRIARYFIDSKIPVDSRDEQILVTIGNEVLWHVGGRRGESYKVYDTTKYILRLIYEGGYYEGSD